MSSKKKNNFNLYLYDIYLRFPNTSITLAYNFIKYMGSNPIQFSDKDLTENLPIFNNFNLNFFTYNTRNIQVAIGRVEKFPPFLTFFEDYLNYITNIKFSSFFSIMNKFLTLKNTKLNFFYKLSNLLIFTNIQKNSNFLNFFLVKKKKNYFLKHTNLFELYQNNLYQNTKFKSFKNLKKFNIQLNLRNKIKKTLKIKRLFIKFYLNKNFRERKLSKILKNFSNCPLKTSIIFNELTLKIILKKLFYFNDHDLTYLLNIDIVYLNGLLVKNLNQKLDVNGRIQLKLNKNMFIKKRLYLQKIIKNQKNFEFYFYRFKKVKNSSITKPVAFNKKYFLTLLFLLEDIPSYFEVDYTILTAFLIKKPQNLYKNNIIKNYFLNYFALNFLNWKYLY